ncbi:Uncharacterised protein [Xylophilus ampelinus]|nr:Uncharacterised protein [Xylophilus ampelinus]
MRTPQSILEVLWAQGFTVELRPDGKLLVSPASTLHDSERDLLRANKPAIVAYLKECQAEAERLEEQLLAAAMRACDRWGDDDARREEMRRDCLKTPAELKPDLLRYFSEQYGRRR